MNTRRRLRAAAERITMRRLFLLLGLVVMTALLTPRGARACPT
jgi:hypothetical protein